MYVAIDPLILVTVSNTKLRQETILDCITYVQDCILVDKCIQTVLMVVVQAQECLRPARLSHIVTITHRMPNA